MGIGFVWHEINFVFNFHPIWFVAQSVQYVLKFPPEYQLIFLLSVPWKKVLELGLYPSMSPLENFVTKKHHSSSVTVHQGTNRILYLVLLPPRQEKYWQHAQPWMRYGLILIESLGTTDILGIGEKMPSILNFFDFYIDIHLFALAFEKGFMPFSEVGIDPRILVLPLFFLIGMLLSCFRQFHRLQRGFILLD